MKFVGKIEFLSPKIIKRNTGVSYYRVTVVEDNGQVSNLALTPIEYKKSKKRASRGVLYQRPTLLMRLYAALVVLFS